ncbi:MAG: ankyrin repeat domain-containing protein [Candidatus Micrarchaeia archaeon]
MAISVVSLEEKRKELSNAGAPINPNARPFLSVLQKDELRKRMSAELIDCIKHKNVCGAVNAIKNGADVNARDAFSRTALMLAVITDQTELAMFLVKLGASVNAADEFGQTPLMWASMSGNTELVKFLIENGANVKAVDMHGCDALMMSIHGNKKTAQVLINAGAEPKLTDASGRSAIDRAKLMNKMDMVELLTSYCYSEA